MKVRGTNAKVSDLAGNIQRALDAFKDNQPINFRSEIYESVQNIWLGKIRNKLNPDKFEKLVQFYFETIGANVYLPPKKEKDKAGDVDVIATFEALRTNIYIQVKHHSGATDEKAVQQIIAFAESNKKDEDDEDYQSNQYWVISSADKFTEEGKNLAKKNDVQLIDGPQFVRMLINSGIGNLSDVYWKS